MGNLIRSRFLNVLVWATLVLLCRAQGPSLADILSFETEHPAGAPGGWNIAPPGSVLADGDIVHRGRWSARIERPAGSVGSLSGISKFIPMDFEGKTLEMRGFLRTEDVTGFVGMWMREDGDSQALGFDNMQRLNLRGTNDWKEYSITIPVHQDARQLVFGVFVTGTGRAWVDDLQLLVDGKPTQRIGIIPDVEVRPTIAGIRAGRDEVLEAAVRQILGPDTPAEQIEKIVKK